MKLLDLTIYNAVLYKKNNKILIKQSLRWVDKYNYTFNFFTKLFYLYFKKL